MTQTLLIVEDRESSVRLFNLALSEKYTLVHTGDGAQALPLAKQHKPDLILMDVQLPNISGMDAIALIRADKEVKHIPILAISAMGIDFVIDKTMAAGANDFLSKPFLIDDLFSKIAALLPSKG